ncbi:hypothetical protein BT96DRAFT_1006327 [Gymnopus androsaceus JB14]|uniref:Uncharacterized protein n=1 Tax=Gymnopus androsaceus JB14 TaxID=1447944 RepID=A0A6A4GLK6_9AGAR|nr:hypothetical protein BT96DRAFT_1006327 [Gymnopus androsaceus JB14]
MLVLTQWLHFLDATETNGKDSPSMNATASGSGTQQVNTQQFNTAANNPSMLKMLEIKDKGPGWLKSKPRDKSKCKSKPAGQTADSGSRGTEVRGREKGKGKAQVMEDGSESENKEDVVVEEGGGTEVDPKDKGDGKDRVDREDEVDGEGKFNEEDKVDEEQLFEGKTAGDIIFGDPTTPEALPPSPSPPPPETVSSTPLASHISIPSHVPAPLSPPLIRPAVHLIVRVKTPTPSGAEFRLHPTADKESGEPLDQPIGSATVEDESSSPDAATSKLNILIVIRGCFAKDS